MPRHVIVKSNGILSTLNTLQKLTTMSRFSAPNTFVDSEDPQLVVDAKRQPIEPSIYSYTEVAFISHLEPYGS